ncbi:MAG: clan AA aspartic protease, partial [Deltaproteobacteria bacterium]|nr:clan AA aspartic protease [Deltaproteobacteria bacterium]
KRRCVAILLFLILAVFLNPKESRPEFYKYIDKDGKIHYVDSMSKIPKEYRKDLTTYKEKYDHLSEEEKEKKIAEDRQKLEEDRQRKEAAQKQLQEEWDEKIRLEKLAQEDLLKKQEEERLEEERQKAKSDKDEFLKNFETNVKFEYNRVLVPCILGYKNYEVEASLVLDTGSSCTIIHTSVAKGLRLKGRIRGTAQVAGGGKLDYKTSKLDYFIVGPYEIEDYYVDIIKHKGSAASYDGLLGMDFLAGRKYNIDYLRGVIRWVP